MADAGKNNPTPAPSGVPTPAPQHDELQQLRHLWASHGTPILVAVALALLAVSAAMLYRNHARRSVQDASHALASARTAQDLEDLITRRPSATLAPLALMKLAKAYFDAGNYDLALSKYGELRTKYPGHSLALLAEMGRISCLEAKGQTEEASKAYRDFAQKHPDNFLTPEAILGEGRCLEALGRLGEARTLYEDFIAAKPDSGWKPRAEELLEALNKKAPAATAATNASSAAADTNSMPVNQALPLSSPGVLPSSD
jgi:predicted negative regulator of RcsB-dependent stress response